MGLGSLIAGQRVTETLATKVTPMDDREGTAANVCTAVLVTTAALRGLPVSTTHVSSGSIIGIGAEARDGRLNLRVIRDMALAWVVTLPAAGLLEAGSLAQWRTPLLTVPSESSRGTCDRVHAALPWLRP
jgi:inorganic phosphate transporter, PiT family